MPRRRRRRRSKRPPVKVLLPRPVTAQGLTVSSATNENNHRVVSVTVAGSPPACWAASSATWHTYRKFSGAAQHWAISLPSRRLPRLPDRTRSTVQHSTALRVDNDSSCPSSLFVCVPHHTVYASILFLAPRRQLTPKFGHSQALLCTRIFWCHTSCTLDLGDVSSGASLSLKMVLAN